MDRKNACEEIINLFVGISKKYQSLEKIPIKYGNGPILYHSERHFLDLIGDNPSMNITDFASYSGVTKGAISQVVKKLERKQLVQRFKGSENDKEIFLKLTQPGERIYREHAEVNRETVNALLGEMKKYSDDKIFCLIEMFKWIDSYLAESKKQMLHHSEKSG